MTMTTLHGGPDAAGVPRWDFSTNANACGPAPRAWRAVQQADASRYPDPAYTELRARLGAFHAVPADRIVVAASASEFIWRMTAVVARRWPQATVHVPRPGFADYGLAAQALGLRSLAQPGDALLVWQAEPSSPAGTSQRSPGTREDAVLVLDMAYAPLRLEGEPPSCPAHAWRLMSPNKALGLTGVRGAYAIAPQGAEALQATLENAAASWVLGAHGVAMLNAWADEATQAWVAESLLTLRDWKRQQLALCEDLGWACQPSVTPFYLAAWHDPSLLARLRERGVKLRDTASLGLPGHVRLSVQPPLAQQALREAWQGLRP